MEYGVLISSYLLTSHFQNTIRFAAGTVGRGDHSYLFSLERTIAPAVNRCRYAFSQSYRRALLNMISLVGIIPVDKDSVHALPNLSTNNKKRTHSEVEDAEVVGGTMTLPPSNSVSAGPFPCDTNDDQNPLSSDGIEESRFRSSRAEVLNSKRVKAVRENTSQNHNLSAPVTVGTTCTNKSFFPQVRGTVSHPLSIKCPAFVPTRSLQPTLSIKDGKITLVRCSSPHPTALSTKKSFEKEQTQHIGESESDGETNVTTGSSQLGGCIKSSQVRTGSMKNGSNLLTDSSCTEKKMMSVASSGTDDDNALICFDHLVDEDILPRLCKKEDIHKGIPPSSCENDTKALSEGVKPVHIAAPVTTIAAMDVFLDQSTGFPFQLKHPNLEALCQLKFPRQAADEVPVTSFSKGQARLVRVAEQGCLKALRTLHLDRFRKQEAVRKNQEEASRREAQLGWERRALKLKEDATALLSRRTLRLQDNASIWHRIAGEVDEIANENAAPSDHRNDRSPNYLISKKNAQPPSVEAQDDREGDEVLAPAGDSNVYISILDFCRQAEEECP